MNPKLSSYLNDLENKPQYTGIAILIICAVGAAIRLWGLDDRSLWLDEMFSSLYAQSTWADVIEMRKQGTNPPLYHFLLSLWVSLFEGFQSGKGTAGISPEFRTISAYTLRSFSVLAGVLSIWGVWRLGRALFDVRTGMIAAVVLCISHMAIAYSMEARFYALNEALAILSTWAVYRWGTSRSLKAGLAWLGLMIVFVWMHTFGWFILTAHGIWLLWLIARAPDFAEKKRRFIELCVGMGVIVLSFLPWVPILATQMQRVSSGYWIKKPMGFEFIQCVYDYLLPARQYNRIILCIALALAVLCVVGMIWKRKPTAVSATEASSDQASTTSTSKRSEYILLACAILVPFLIPWGWSFIGTPIFQVKYTIVGQAMAILLFARWMRFRPLIPLLLIAAMCQWTHPWFYEGYPLIREHWKDVATFIKQNGEDEPVIFLCHDYCWFPMVQYYDHPEHITCILPPDEEVTDFVHYYAHPFVYFADFQNTLAKQDRDVWVVLSRIRSVDGQPFFDDLVGTLTSGRPILKEYVESDLAAFHLGPPRETQNVE